MDLSPYRQLHEESAMEMKPAIPPDWFESCRYRKICMPIPQAITMESYPLMDDDKERGIRKH
jgi:hypothetical protein